MMSKLFPLVFLAAGSVAHAADTQVLVSAFQSTDSVTDASSESIRAAIDAAVARSSGLKTVQLTAVPAVGDTAALDYAMSCPPGEYVGCAFVLGESARVSLAVTGVVSPGDDGHLLVEVHVVDVPQSADLISFVGDLDPRSEVGVFAATVASVVESAARGEVKAGGDIRAAAPIADAGRAEKQIAGRQLDQLQGEIGGHDAVGDASVREFVREKYTMDDMASDMQTDGAKPWERLGMTPQQYLRYKNSGMKLYEWREREMGRKGQILVRGYGGYGRGPNSVSYYARQGLSAQDLSTIQTYAWVTQVDSGAGRGGLEVAYGVLPELEVGLQLGVTAGKFEADIQALTEGQYVPPPNPQSVGFRLPYYGAQVLYAPLQVFPVRPVVGTSFTMMRSKTVDNFFGIDPELPTFSPLTTARLGIIVGGEARMSDRIDVFLHVPVHLTVGGRVSDELQQGAGVLTDLAVAKPVGSVYAGLQAGIQVRFLGAEPDTRTRGEDPDDF